MDGNDLVEPEGVNAGSAQAQQDSPPHGDPVPGGDPDRAPEHAPPAGRLPGPPPEPAGNHDDVYGSTPPA